MKVTSEYKKEKDIWCLLKYGKGSMNSSTQTKVYEQLVSFCGEDLNEENTSKFIDKYLLGNNLNVEEYISKYQNNWDKISDRFQEITENIFGVSLEEDVTSYLTVNNRCPYYIEGSYFFVSLPTESSTRIAMHELWHFYTWYKFGIVWEEKLGKQKYNEIKEALTVLLNVECKDLLPEGAEDKGYPQHQELRKEILKLWEEDKNIDNLWNKLITI